MTIRMRTKAQRALQLLLGLRHAQVAAALADYGFTDEDLQEGWELLQAFGRVRVDTAVPSADLETVRALDEWENQWFPLVDAALLRRFPAAHAALFLNLHQTAGPEVALLVHLFVDRIDAMSGGKSACGAEGVEAVKWLAKRGLKPEVLRQARDLLAELRRVADSAVPVCARRRRPRSCRFRLRDRSY